MAGLKRKKNSGFSLIEVIVAIAILAIVSLPIIKAFSTSAMINKNARSQENANAVAKTIMEDFKSLTFEQLKEKYSDYSQNNGVYTFNIDKYEGVNGEEFEVKITMDPSAYTNGSSSNTANNINSYLMPQYSDVSKQSSFVLREAMYTWDGDAKAWFSALVNHELYRDEDIVRNVKIVNEIGFDGDVLVQTVSGTITYTYNSNKVNAEPLVKTISPEVRELKAYNGAVHKGTNEEPFEIINDEGGLCNLYIFYLPYSETDRIEIDSRYDTKLGTIHYSNLNTYIVQQTDKLFKSNITLSINGIAAGALSSKDFYGNTANIYTNISDGDSNGNLTEGTAKDYLYSVTVQVNLDGEEIANVVSTRKDK